MRFPGKPYYLIEKEEAEQKLNTKRILKSLTGQRSPSLEYVIEKMRREYSRYGKDY